MPLKSSISSHVRISYRFYEFVTTRYTTDFYIIKYNKITLYPTRADGIIVLVNSQTGFCRPFFISAIIEG